MNNSDNNNGNGNNDDHNNDENSNDNNNDDDDNNGNDDGTGNTGDSGPSGSQGPAEPGNSSNPRIKDLDLDLDDHDTKEVLYSTLGKTGSGIGSVLGELVDILFFSTFNRNSLSNFKYLFEFLKQDLLYIIIFFYVLECHIYVYKYNFVLTK